MTTYNKSRIMKEAHRLVRVENYTISQALRLAWVEAKRSEFYQIFKTVEYKETSIVFDMNMLANSLTNYYANNRYNGD